MKLSHVSATLAVVSAGMWSCGGYSGSSSTGSSYMAPSSNFAAQLSAANETPPVSTMGSGTVALTLNGSTMNYAVYATGLSGNATGAHIHIGPVGQAGPIVVDFAAITPPPAGTTTTFAGSFTAANIKNPTTPPLNPPVVTMDDLIAQIRSGNAYFNIHTAAHPGGEIRGQLSVQ